MATITIIERPSTATNTEQRPTLRCIWEACRAPQATDGYFCSDHERTAKRTQPEPVREDRRENVAPYLLRPGLF